ncbi:hypothetical protein E2C01_099471 [Portunus trituberculatus]|uniref:Uncharacterized protein n=1 Tax=Portunus trituberculatus TaxID=210409 RepID=A0A5B7KB24_PORTR|nr:hypothetical protein [Portunus trituberculatus]
MQCVTDTCWSTMSSSLSESDESKCEVILGMDLKRAGDNEAQSDGIISDSDEEYLSENNNEVSSGEENYSSPYAVSIEPVVGTMYSTSLLQLLLSLASSSMAPVPCSSAAIPSLPPSHTLSSPYTTGATPLVPLLYTRVLIHIYFVTEIYQNM